MNNKDKGNAHIVIGAVAVLLGVLDMASLSSARPTGRWSLIFGPLFDSFGPMGPAIAHIGIGVLLVALGFFYRGKK